LVKNSIFALPASYGIDEIVLDHEQSRKQDSEPNLKQPLNIR